MGEIRPRPKYSTDLASLERETDVETFRSSKPGGQRRDKVETAVRLRHRPSGITVVASDFRSQAQNRELAFTRLREKLIRLNRPPKPRLRTRPPLSSLQQIREDKERLSQKKRLRRRPEPVEEV
ncbi:MAG TPA: peptide chain release factor-like protein [Dehalococcoidia bacterium]|nr:peptide chain release factor-like protein [Dehalococcoidia bacterium]